MQSYLKPDILKLNNVSREYRGISMTCSDAVVEYIMTTNLEYRLCALNLLLMKWVLENSLKVPKLLKIFELQRFNRLRLHPQRWPPCKA